MPNEPTPHVDYANVSSLETRREGLRELINFWRNMLKGTGYKEGDALVGESAKAYNQLRKVIEAERKLH